MTLSLGDLAIAEVGALLIPLRGLNREWAPAADWVVLREVECVIVIFSDIPYAFANAFSPNAFGVLRPSESRLYYVSGCVLQKF